MMRFSEMLCSVSGDMAIPIVLESYGDQKVKISDTLAENRKIGSTDCELPVDVRINGNFTSVADIN